MNDVDGATLIERKGRFKHLSFIYYSRKAVDQEMAIGIHMSAHRVSPKHGREKQGLQYAGIQCLLNMFFGIALSRSGHSAKATTGLNINHSPSRVLLTQNTIEAFDLSALSTS